MSPEKAPQPLRRVEHHHEPAEALIERALGAELTRHLLDPWACMRDVLARLPTHLNSRIDDLLPHRWQPLQTTD